MAGFSKNGIGYVDRPSGYRARWSHQGRRYSFETGTRDRGLAIKAAEAERSRVILAEGQLTQAKKTGNFALRDHIIGWIEWLETQVQADTARGYGQAAKHWPWETIKEMNTEKALSDHQTALLRRLGRESTRKHLIYAKSFLKWCRVEGLIPSIAAFPEMGDNVTGTRQQDGHRQNPTIFDAEQAEKLIAALPEWVYPAAQVNISREKLYELVWSMPRMKVAKRLELSDVGLGKMCKRLNVPMPSKYYFNHVSSNRSERAPLPKDDSVRRVRVRDYYRVLWDTAWRPATVDRLAAPKHYTPKAQIVNVQREIVKDRNRARKMFDKPFAPVEVPETTQKALTRSIVGPGLIFGDERAVRGRILAEVAQEVLGLYVTDYDFKHSRCTHLCNLPNANYAGISYYTGVELETLMKHYVHEGYRNAKKFVASL